MMSARKQYSRQGSRFNRSSENYYGRATKAHSSSDTGHSPATEVPEQLRPQLIDLTSSSPEPDHIQPKPPQKLPKEKGVSKIAQLRSPLKPGSNTRAKKLNSPPRLKYSSIYVYI